MVRKQIDIHEAIDRLHASAAGIGRRVTFMEVCGTHTMSAFRSGLHSLMPENVTLLSGPGCPVCVTAQGDIDLMIDLASHREVTLCTYGDMMRVPGRRGSLEKARGGGADVRAVYSSTDAVKWARAQPDRQVVFAAVGFETTAPATAAAVLRAQRENLGNFSVLASHKRVIPAMTGLLDSGQVNLDGFLCPGHVSVIIGPESYRPIVERYGLPCVITGFEELNMAAGLARLTEMVRARRCELVNQYPEAVRQGGNRKAKAVLSEVFEPVEARWRGLGAIPHSGLGLRDRFREFDAVHRFDLTPPLDQEHPGCICGQVIRGVATPHDCKLFGTACTPINPLGPCMVSSEGTCQAWFKYNRSRESRPGAHSPGIHRTSPPPIETAPA
jgi:hydrogenase expression/formation protein HypD